MVNLTKILGDVYMTIKESGAPPELDDTQVSSIKHTLSHNVLFLRLYLGFIAKSSPYDQNEFSKLLQISSSGLRRWESGEVIPNQLSLHMLCNLTNKTLNMEHSVNPEDLLCKNLVHELPIIIASHSGPGTRVDTDTGFLSHLVTEVSDVTARDSVLLNHSVAGIYMTDEAMIITFVNPAFCRITGYDRLDLLGINLLDIIHSEDRSTIIALATTSKKLQNTVCVRMLSTDKGTRHMEIMQERVSGRSVSFIGNVIDITDRVKHNVLTEIRSELNKRLGLVHSVKDAANIFIEYLCNMDEIDSGCLYLFDQDNMLKLYGNYGLPDYFIQHVHEYDKDGQHSKLVTSGMPLYNALDYIIEHKLLPDEILLNDFFKDITSISMVPIQVNNKYIGCFIVFSKKYKQLDAMIQHFLSSISNTIGLFIEKLSKNNKIRENEILLKTLLGSINDHCMLIGVDGSIIVTNKPCKDCDNDCEYMCNGKKYITLPQHITNGNSLALNTKTIYQSNTDDGRIIRTEIRPSTKIDDVEYSVYIARDITEMALERAMMQKDKSMLSDIINFLPFGIAIFDNNSILQYINRKFTEITSYDKDTILTRTDWENKAEPKSTLHSNMCVHDTPVYHIKNPRGILIKLHISEYITGYGQVILVIYNCTKEVN